MLLWSRKNRLLVWAVFALVFAVLFGLPLLTVALASISGQWNGVLPSNLTLQNYSNVFQGAAGASLVASLVTGVIASCISLVLGTWAALATRDLGHRSRRMVDLLFLMPIAVPTVSIGLALLVAFSRPPIVLLGTATIVILAHVVLVTAFSYSNISAGLARMSRDHEQIAALLGATPGYVLRKVTLPMLTPQLLAAASLAFALSMGELAATVMIYPADWMTMPVRIFAYTDRGNVFEGSAMAVMLVLFTFVMLLITSRIRTKAAFR